MLIIDDIVRMYATLTDAQCRKLWTITMDMVEQNAILVSSSTATKEKPKRQWITKIRQ